MDGRGTSVLKFKGYVVKEILYRANESYRPDNDGVTLDFDFDASMSYSEDNRKMVVELGVIVFKDAAKKNYPFEMSVCLKGFFSMRAGSEMIQVFESNAIAILFPYIRAIVSTYTANANIAPVILPPMNINEYLRNKKKNKEDKQV